MIIVSQDKTKITEKLELSVIENEIYFEGGVLGTYQTKERAKEVLEEIIKEYLYCNEQDCMNNIGYVQNRIYEMPKE